MNRLMVVSALVLGACGSSAAKAVVAVQLKPEVPIVVARGSTVTRTIHVTARDLLDNSEVPGVTVTPECLFVVRAPVTREQWAQATSCTFSASTVVTPADLVVTITTTVDAPIGQRLAALDLRFHTSTSAVATLQSAGREITVTE
jgi:hypothetical protein